MPTVRLCITNDQSIIFTFNQESRVRNLQSCVVTEPMHIGNALLFSSVQNAILLVELASCVVFSQARCEHKNVAVDVFSKRISGVKRGTVVGAGQA